MLQEFGPDTIRNNFPVRQRLCQRSGWFVPIASLTSSPAKSSSNFDWPVPEWRLLWHKGCLGQLALHRDQDWSGELPIPPLLLADSLRFMLAVTDLALAGLRRHW